MKSEAGNSGETVELEKNHIDIQEVAIAALKTVLLLDVPFGARYIAKLLRGDNVKYLKSKDHAEFETVGSITHFSQTELRLCLQRLMEKGYLEPATRTLARLKISEKGQEYLSNPVPIPIPISNIRLTPEQALVHRKLREYRRSTSAELGVPPYQIFNDMTLDYLAKELPLKTSYLLGIGNLTEFKVERYGKEIVATIKAARDEFREIRRMGIQRRVEHITHQRVLRLHNEGKTPDDIALTLGIKENTVKSYLMNFHLAGQQDMRTTIENLVPSQTLFVCTEMFRRAPESRIGEVAQTLEVPYVTALMAQTYITDFQPCREIVAA